MGCFHPFSGLPRPFHIGPIGPMASGVTQGTGAIFLPAGLFPSVGIFAPFPPNSRDDGTRIFVPNASTNYYVFHGFR